ncbi:MAG: hypothetical protein WD382_00610 [Halofilum sp. (in: g-proteobacteria)]
MTDTPPIQGGRRAFFRKLFGLGVAAGAGAWVARRGATPPSATASASVAPASATTYRETEHIRKVYRSARG